MIYEERLFWATSVKDGLLVYHSRTKAILYRDLYRAGIITGASMGKKNRHERSSLGPGRISINLDPPRIRDQGDNRDDNPLEALVS